MTMRAARYYGKNDIRIDEISEPTPGPGEVKVKIAFNGICGTDLHEFYDGPRVIPLEPHPLTGSQVPVVLGHEAAGYVVETGINVKDGLEGALVAIDPLRPCGTCAPCAVGRPNLCDRLAMHGLSTDGGGLAQYTVVPAGSLHRIPDGLSARQAALVEPLAVARHAVGRWQRTGDGSAAVFGGGPIGIAIALSLRAQGLHEVYVIEPSVERQRAVNQFCFQVIDPYEADPAIQLRDLTRGRGVDVCFETAGAATSFQSAISSTSKQGTVVVVASGRHQVVAPLAEMLRSELTVTTTFASSGDFGAVIEALSEGAYPTEGWVSTIPLDELLDGLAKMHNGIALKLLVDPWA
jgi:(R,R)-butanediol dehydrogenase/meso-butanediol dehydrogenase/diacetyl reductase